MKNHHLIRITAFLLALVCVVGFLPAPASAAGALSSAPASITQQTCDFMKVGGQVVHYKSASSLINDVGQPSVFDEQMDVPGYGPARALCAKFLGRLSYRANGQRWNFKEEVSSASLKTILTYIYSHTNGDFTDAGRARGLDQWGEGWTNLWFITAQGLSWYYEYGILKDVNANREAFIEQVAEEFLAAMKLCHDAYNWAHWITDWDSTGIHTIIDSADNGVTGNSSYDFAAVAVNTVLDHPEYYHNMSLSEISNMVANGRTSVQPVISAMFPGGTGNDSPTGNTHSYLYWSIDPQTGEKVDLTGEDTVTDGITDAEVPVLSTEMNGGMYTSIPTLAATFNTELARRQGEMFGEDNIYIGDVFVWGSGCNLHRAPYGGRHAEYYSSDPVHTSLMAAAQTAGAWSKGTILVNKHFAINEQEQNRIGVATFANEQTIRECELRAFEGVFTYGDGRGLMASYNRIGLIGTASEYDLMTTVLREEWGSNCYVITDLNGPTAGLYDGNAIIAAGTSTMLNNGPYDQTSGAYVNTTLSVDFIRNDPVLRTAAREACHRMLYNYVNSVAMNGVSSNTRIETITPWWQTAFFAADAVLGTSTVIITILYLICVNKKREEK